MRSGGNAPTTAMAHTQRLLACIACLAQSSHGSAYNYIHSTRLGPACLPCANAQRIRIPSLALPALPAHFDRARQ